MAASGQDAYCTLLLSDNYLPGAMVLAHSLRDNGTRKQLAVLVTLDSLSASTIEELRTVYDQVIPVDRITNRSPANLFLMNRGDLGSTFTKIALWRQTQFRRIVYVDADIVALRAPDNLFALESSFAAVTDIGWPDCFNSGVMALTPNMGDYYALLALAQRGISFDGADQGLLNMHFGNWERLSFTYNCTPSGNYQYVPAYKHFQSSIRMMHFIGRDKPWTIGRDTRGTTGACEELLGRWWAVYDRHYRRPTTVYVPGRTGSSSRTVQQHVYGEPYTTDYGFSSLSQESVETQKSEFPQVTSEEPFLEKTETDAVESINKGEAMPVSTLEQRRFSAPQTEWDPIRQPPPPKSKPEASNFPTHQYTMSQDRELFQPPKSYPQPPKDMYYEVPKSRVAAERPKQIFPWEANQAKPTRVFAEDDLPSPGPVPSIIDAESSIAASEAPTTPIIQVSSPEPFSSYSRTNAWDEMPEIERYIQAFNLHRRGKAPAPPADPSDSEVTSPSSRRPSMRLTDFPTEVERPSLPVTPAPIHRPTFWGEDREDPSRLSGAEGVPKQEDWNPMAKLEELQRRQSEVLAQGAPPPPTATRNIPDRNLPEHASLLPTSEETEVPMSSVSASANHGSKDPLFRAVDFEVGEKSGRDEGVFSPTES